MITPLRLGALLFTVIGLSCLLALGFFLYAGVALDVGRRSAWRMVSAEEGAPYYSALAFWGFIGVGLFLTGIAQWRESNRPAPRVKRPRLPPRPTASPASVLGLVVIALALAAIGFGITVWSGG